MHPPLMSLPLQIAQALLFMHLEAVGTKQQSYPTACKPGQQLISKVQFQTLRLASLRSADRT